MYTVSAKHTKHLSRDDARFLEPHAIFFQSVCRYLFCHTVLTVSKNYSRNGTIDSFTHLLMIHFLNKMVNGCVSPRAKYETKNWLSYPYSWVRGWRR